MVLALVVFMVTSSIILAVAAGAEAIGDELRAQVGVKEFIVGIGTVNIGMANHAGGLSHKAAVGGHVAGRNPVALHTGAAAGLA